MSSTTSSTSGGSAKPKRSRGEVARLVFGILLAVLITLFAVLNTGSVQVDWIFGSSSAPLIIVIVISLLVGVVLTHIVDRRTLKR